MFAVPPYGDDDMIPRLTLNGPFPMALAGIVTVSFAYAARSIRAFGKLSEFEGVRE